MPKVDLDAIAQTNRTGYPAAVRRAVAGRWYGGSRRPPA